MNSRSRLLDSSHLAPSRKWATVPVLLLLLAGFLLPMSSCKRDKCKRVVCVNGTCLDGTCNCESGYYGTDCSAIINDGLGGVWDLTEECTAGSDEYEVVVQIPEGDLLNVKMVGIWEQADTLTCTFQSDGMNLSIGRTSLGNVEVEATGSIAESRDEITLNYKVYNPGAGNAFDVCVATLTKQ